MFIEDRQIEDNSAHILNNTFQLASNKAGLLRVNLHSFNLS